MKKYNLIKWYPGLPANAIKAVQTSENWYRITDEGEQTMFGSVTAATIEQSPEFWIPAPKKMGYVTINGEPIFEGETIWYAYPTKDYVGAPEKWIWSFTTATEYSRTDYPYVTFFKTEEAAKMYVDRMTPKPLFKTIDGKSIFPGDRFWGIGAGYLLKQYIVERQDSPDSMDGIKPFATKEAAEEWLVMNKPMVALSDLIDPNKGPWYINLSSRNIGKIRSLIESRLRNGK